MTRIALVTDSTASLPPELIGEYEISVVPLQVVIGSKSYDEGSADEVTPQRLAEALREWTPVSTSRPNPEVFLAEYERLARGGADEIVSVHLSGKLSGTVESARLAAGRAPVPVSVVDTGQVGIATGFAVLAAVEARGRGGCVADIAGAAQRCGAATTSLFYVDTLEYLRRGGRVGATAALVGSALAVKPILAVAEGRIGPRERVRTAGKALARLEDMAVAAVEGRVRVAVAHLASSERAATLAEHLSDRLGEQIVGEVFLAEIGAVLGAHVGPGMVAVCIAPQTTCTAPGAGSSS